MRKLGDNISMVATISCANLPCSDYLFMTVDVEMTVPMRRQLSFYHANILQHNTCQKLLVFISPESPYASLCMRTLNVTVFSTF